MDQHRVLAPDFPGNRRLDSYRNLLENPRESLLFLIPGLGETLRIEGRACLTRDEDLLAGLAMNGRPPKLGLGVEVDAAFIHCAKAFIRSGAWRPDTWPSELPSASQILRDHISLPEVTVEYVEERLGEDYETKLY